MTPRSGASTSAVYGTLTGTWLPMADGADSTVAGATESLKSTKALAGTNPCTLSFGSTRQLQLFGGDIARAADSCATIIELRVGDVDAELPAVSGRDRRQRGQKPRPAMRQPLIPPPRSRPEPHARGRR
jgi:hypothetical protein